MKEARQRTVPGTRLTWHPMLLHKRLIAAAVAAAALATATLASSQGVGWGLVNWKVRHDFPDVRRIEPKQLADWLNDRARPQPVLLDVRTKAEYEISHIHGAERVEPGSDADAIRLSRTTPIVTYCSVGYRSGAFAKKLQDAGYKNVQNLSGSIFAWANGGYPVERNGRRVTEVHPYNKVWGKLLNERLRAQVRPAGEGM